MKKLLFKKMTTGEMRNRRAGVELALVDPRTPTSGGCYSPFFDPAGDCDPILLTPGPDCCIDIAE